MFRPGPLSVEDASLLDRMYEQTRRYETMSVVAPLELHDNVLSTGDAGAAVDCAGFIDDDVEVVCEVTVACVSGELTTTRYWKTLTFECGRLKAVSTCEISGGGGGPSDGLPGGVYSDSAPV